MDARSQYLPEYQLDLNSPDKLNLAFKLCLEHVLKKIPGSWPIKEVAVYADPKDIDELGKLINMTLMVSKVVQVPSMSPPPPSM